MTSPRFENHLGRRGSRAARDAVERVKVLAAVAIDQKRPHPQSQNYSNGATCLANQNSFETNWRCRDLSQNSETSCFLERIEGRNVAKLPIRVSKVPSIILRPAPQSEWHQAVPCNPGDASPNANLSQNSPANRTPECLFARGRVP